MKPLLPSANLLLPYLERIDNSRWYSNSGPLVREYEERLKEMYGVHVVSCSSATSGLIACLMAIGIRGRKINVPSWTFVATISAIYASGNVPCFRDIGEMKPVFGEFHLPVLPLGDPINLLEWDIPGNVVIDGAAAFDSLFDTKIGESPIVVSTHGTKVFGTGEGGFILVRNGLLAAEIEKVLNQGMEFDKTVGRLGFNGKLSEYHAAVGLAELDGWEEKRENWLRVQEWYGDDREWVTSTQSVFIKEGRDIEAVLSKLDKARIQYRRSWYGLAHKQKCYGAFNGTLPKTDLLRDRTLFLPKFVDMKREEVQEVVGAIQ